MPASTQRRLKWKKPTLLLISFHEVRIASKPRKKVNSSMTRLKPSRAREKLIPHCGIQGMSSLINQAEAAPGNTGFPLHRYKAMIKSVRTVAKAIQREEFSSHFSANQAS